MTGEKTARPRHIAASHPAPSEGSKEEKEKSPQKVDHPPTGATGQIKKRPLGLCVMWWWVGDVCAFLLEGYMEDI